MKKTLVLFTIIAIIASCGNNSQQENTVNETSNDQPVEQQPAVASDADAEAGLQLIAKSDCLTCHKVSDQLVGPSYMSVAEKYKGDTTVISTLADRIIKGSQGHWGTVPMTPHPSLSMEDARLMVKYVLSLNQ